MEMLKISPRICTTCRGGRRVAGGQCPLTMRTAAFYYSFFPAPPGIVTERNGERKRLHRVRIDSGGTPPRPVSFYVRHWILL